MTNLLAFKILAISVILFCSLIPAFTFAQSTSVRIPAGAIAPAVPAARIILPPAAPIAPVPAVPAMRTPLPATVAIPNGGAQLPPAPIAINPAVTGHISTQQRIPLPTPTVAVVPSNRIPLNRTITTTPTTPSMTIPSNRTPIPNTHVGAVQTSEPSNRIPLPNTHVASTSTPTPEPTPSPSPSSGGSSSNNQSSNNENNGGSGGGGSQSAGRRPTTSTPTPTPTPQESVNPRANSNDPVQDPAAIAQVNEPVDSTVVVTQMPAPTQTSPATALVNAFAKPENGIGLAILILFGIVSLIYRQNKPNQKWVKK